MLGEAIDKAVKDKEFLTQAAKRKAEVDPTSGAELQKVIAAAYATPKEVVDAAKAALKGYKKNCNGEYCKKKKKKKKKKKDA